MILEKILWVLYLACNNYEIIDLGVMVSADKILEEAKKQECRYYWFKWLNNTIT